MENEPNTFTVRLFKRPPHGLGFLVRKRKTNPPVIISDLIPDGVADQSGLIQVGDILLAVNGVQLTDVPYSTALEVLRSVPMDSPTVLVMRGPDGYRTRLESILTPDGAVKVVRVTEEINTDSLSRDKGSGRKKSKGHRDAGNSPPPVGNPVPCWQRNHPTYDAVGGTAYGSGSTYPGTRGRAVEGSSYRYASPIRSSSRTRRESSRSPARSSLPGSPVRGYSYRDPSACCCVSSRHQHASGTDYQNVLAWNGTFPRDVYQFRLGIEDLYNFDSPRPSVDYECDGDRLPAKNCLPQVDGSPERPFESVGTQWPERVIVVQGTSPSSQKRPSVGAVNGVDLSVKVTASEPRPHIGRQDSATQITTEESNHGDAAMSTTSILRAPPPQKNSPTLPSKEVRPAAYQGEIIPTEVNNNAVKPAKVCTAEIEIQTDLMGSQIGENQSSKNGTNKGSNGANKPKFVRLKNLLDGKQTTDTLHQKSIAPLQCSESRCMGSIMFPPRKAGSRSKETIIEHATDFINQYYTHIKRFDTPAHKKRLQVVVESIEKKGTYDLTETELILGAKTAWRNAPRCIGRIQWTKLQVFDARNTTSTHQMFDAICNHMNYATNKGNLRSAITIFPHRTDGQHDFRVWNTQLISYAGYKQPDGSIIGDPANVEFTEICMQKLGWHPDKQGRFDVLPLVLQANGEDPELFNIPPDLVLEVQLHHPKYDWFADLGLKWYALPAVSALMLDLGGLEFTACPFNGWYMVTEIGARDICDPNRLNLLETIGKKMGLDTNSNASLWKDQALVEANVAVIHSYQKNNVTITDHHSAAESFLKHMENEQRLRGGCPADWVWVVPPISGSITPVFHQEMLNYQLKPSYEYQDAPWATHVWKAKDEAADAQKTRRRRRTFKEVAKAVKFSAKLMGKALAKRFKATILYATETGRSEKYAKSLCEIFKHAFDAKVMCMEEYDVVHLEHETLLLIVTSTFGNGDPPENGEEFGRYLMDLARDSSDDQPESRALRFDKYFAAPSTPSQKAAGLSNLSESSGVLANVRFAVFGLGSTAYPNFCAYARAVDTLLGNLGGERILDMGEGDELSGQEESYRKWAQEVFKQACDTFCVGEGINMNEANASLMENDQSWTADKFRIGLEDTHPAVERCEGLSKLHGKKVLPCILLARKNLQAPESSRSTILVHMDTQGASELLYDPGDHVAICPSNEKDLVDRIIKRVDLGERSPDDVIKVEFMHVKQTPLGIMKAWIPTDRIPLCSLRGALEQYLDITIAPSPNFLRQLAAMATAQKEKTTLELLSKDTRSYEEWKFDLSPNLAEVLEEFPSARPPASFLLTELPLLKPRFYSISSSTRMYPGEIHATVAVVNYRTRGGDGPLHHGVCSSWLNTIKIGREIPAFIRTAPNFHLPEERSDPLIMVGPGTGIAPFRSFWQQRQIDMRMAKDVGRDNFGAMTLVFGCRQSTLDDLYRSETSEVVKEGALKEVLTALSREKGKPKTYVQHILKERGKEVFKLISENKGHFYVCGDVSMAADVCNTLEQIASEHGNMTAEEAKNYVISMRDQNRYHEDIFGVTLRTEEVKNKVRSAMRRAQVYITGADSKLTPAIKMNDNGVVGGRNSVHTKSMEDVRNKTDMDLNRPPSPTTELMQMKQPRIGRRSITATVLMSDEELKELNRTFDAEQNARSNAINGHPEGKK
ncbi:nitric oxide synthase, brain-like isoform X2 [Acanthaster planci]|uniref:Nitric oxide synthase 1 n=1 Tax=Acanthaster planci TaxID=133434 RepID=A0A8B7Y2X0_ACAPL|nr:nitric oxide synthase, brain-like isoform X2 [Acanthaster planci]